MANDLSNNIMAYCRVRKIPAVNNSVRAGKSPGIEDITLCYRGKFIAIEVKKPKEAQRDNQKIREKSIISNGGKYIIARNSKDLMNILAEVDEELDE